jgi:NitT/TauT family transport system substrate-binding protein
MREHSVSFPSSPRSWLPRAACALAALGFVLLTACQPSPAAAPAAAKPTDASKPAATTGPAAAKPAAGSLTKLRFKYPVVSGAWLPFFLAQDNQIYQKYGLDVEVEILQPQQIVQALVTNQADVIGVPAETALTAHLQGAPIVMVGSMIQSTRGYVMAAGGSSKIEDLKGGTLLVRGLGGVEEFALRRALSASGMDPNSDVTFLNANDFQSMLAGVGAGQAKGFLAVPPEDLLAKRQGMTAVADMSTFNIPYVQASLVTTTAYAQANREALLSFLQATTEAINIVKTDQAQAFATFIKYSKMDDQEIAASAQKYGAEAVGNVPVVSRDGIKNVQEVVSARTPDAAKVEPESFVDFSFGTELEKRAPH